MCSKWTFGPDIHAGRRPVGSPPCTTLPPWTTPSSGSPSTSRERPASSPSDGSGSPTSTWRTSWTAPRSPSPTAPPSACSAIGSPQPSPTMPSSGKRNRTPPDGRVASGSSTRSTAHSRSSTESPCTETWWRSRTSTARRSGWSTSPASTNASGPDGDGVASSTANRHGYRPSPASRAHASSPAASTTGRPPPTCRPSSSPEP